MGVAVYDTAFGPPDGPQSPESESTCYHCGDLGHWKRGCPIFRKAQAARQSQKAKRGQGKKRKPEAEEDAESSANEDDAAEPAPKMRAQKKKKKKVGAHSVGVSLDSGRVVMPPGYLCIDNCATINFHDRRELCSDERSAALVVNGVQGEYSIDDGILARLFCLGESAFLEHAGKSAVAEFNLHPFQPLCEPGRYWRITLPTGDIYFP